MCVRVCVQVPSAIRFSDCGARALFGGTQFLSVLSIIIISGSVCRCRRCLRSHIYLRRARYMVAVSPAGTWTVCVNWSE